MVHAEYHPLVIPELLKRMIPSKHPSSKNRIEGDLTVMGGECEMDHFGDLESVMERGYS